jgi:hypothetical protein
MYTQQIDGWLLFVLLIAAIWTLFWKGLGLWHAARRKDSIWFIVMLIINTLGILEIVYLFAVLKLKRENLFKSK